MPRRPPQILDPPPAGPVETGFMQKMSDQFVLVLAEERKGGKADPQLARRFPEPLIIRSATLPTSSFAHGNAKSRRPCRATRPPQPLTVPQSPRRPAIPHF
jgi:hypothetical protein